MLSQLSYSPVSPPSSHARFFAGFRPSLCSRPRARLSAAIRPVRFLPSARSLLRGLPAQSLLPAPCASIRGDPPLVGSSGLEPPTSRLSGVRSNHLSYEPSSPPAPGTLKIKQRVSGPLTLEVLRFLSSLLRKEVIQPHLPIRLPCYDFTPIIDPTFGGGFLR